MHEYITQGVQVHKYMSDTYFMTYLMKYHIGMAWQNEKLEYRGFYQALNGKDFLD